MEDVDEIILVALNEAGTLHQSYLGSEHLLLAILKNEGLQITQLLNQYGMDYESVRSDVENLNLFYDMSMVNAGYSKAVINIITKADTPSAIVMEILHEKDSLANSLLERYSIFMEKVIH